jgi:pimeloyl-ACP methyl ester carboxylesterase
LINHLTQEAFREQEFDSFGVNLHTRVGRESRGVVLFVHGLGGGGYDTWNEMPRMIFDGVNGVDVALFDYASGLRAWKRRGANLEAQVSRLRATLDDLQKDYEYDQIFIAAHSLGGLIVEVAIQRSLEGLQESPVTAIAAVLLFASPRAGSGWASIPAIREFVWLKRLSKRVSEIDEYYSTHIEGRASPDADLRRFFMPHYACVASNDSFVRDFSAGLGIPAQQRLSLEGTHTSIVKPDSNNHPQVQWVLRVMGEVIALRSFVAKRHTRKDQQLPAAVIVSKLRTGFDGARWEIVYHDVREQLSSSSISVVDSAAYPDAPVDILIVIRSAGPILQKDPAVRDGLLRTYAEHVVGENKHLVGVCAVGENHQEAKEILTEWLPRDAEGFFYIDGAFGDDQIYTVTTRWLQMAIKRNSQRMQGSSRLDRVLDLAPDPYDIPGRNLL